MHKDPRPGVFDLGSRSVRYTIGLGLATGLVLSILANVAVLLWTADAGGASHNRSNADALEASMTARRRSPPPTPAAPADVRY